MPTRPESNGKCGINASHEYVTKSTILQIGQTRQPKLGSLILTEPEPKQLLAPGEIYSDGNVNRML